MILCLEERYWSFQFVRDGSELGFCNSNLPVLTVTYWNFTWLGVNSVELLLL